VNDFGLTNEQQQLRIRSLPPTLNSASALAAARFEWYPPEDLAVRPPYEHFVLYTVPMTFPWLVPSSIKKVVTLVETGQEEAQELSAITVERLASAFSASHRTPPTSCSLDAALPELYNQAKTLFGELMSSLRDEADAAKRSERHRPPTDPEELGKMAAFVATLQERVELTPDGDVEVNWEGGHLSCKFVLTNPPAIDLPDRFIETERPPPAGSPLAKLYDHCAGLCEKYEPLYKSLSGLASAFKVIDPALPCSNKETRRRILCRVEGGRALSVDVELNPLNPEARPAKLRVVGDVSNKTASKYREYKWDASFGLCENLKRAGLGLAEAGGEGREGKEAGAGAGGVDEDKDAMLCGICYGYSLEGEEGAPAELPDVFCPGCSKPFHVSCLKEWLRGDRESSVSFDRIYGACIYCQGKISVKVS